MTEIKEAFLNGILGVVEALVELRLFGIDTLEAMNLIGEWQDPFGN